MSQEEWQKAGETVVQTATGECILRQTESGVLLTNDGDVAPIIPLGELVAQGGVIDWRPGQCRLHHPRAGTLKVTVVANCPYVSGEDGKRLTACLEEEKKKVHGVAKAPVHGGPAGAVGEVGNSTRSQVDGDRMEQKDEKKH